MRRRPRRRFPRRRPRVRIIVPPIYYDPYPYYGPIYSTYRIGCATGRNILRNRGYRRIRAYDCSGTVYGFYASRGGRRYRIRMSSSSGAILVVRRI